MLRRALIAAVVALVALALLPSADGRARPAGPKPCGLTTLQGTIQLTGTGVLACGPGQPVVVREELAEAHPERSKKRKPLTAFVSIADVQLADEESPLRGEWADKCGEHPASAAFRPHETMVPHLFEAHIRAANAIVRAGSPHLGAPIDFAVGLGDLADNQQYNEVRWIIDILDGGGLVDPDSGEDGYDGVQGADPSGADGTIVSPVQDTSILDLANEPFYAAGLRRKDGSRLPWYALPGNHDVKVQGTIPDDNPAWRAFVRAYVVGQLKVMDLAPDHQQALCEDPSLIASPEFWMKVLANPSTTKVVPADEDRRLLDRNEWAAEFATTKGVPAGHGYLPEDNRCRDENGEPLARACYSFDRGIFHFIALDSNPAEGLESGAYDDAQLAWLERELIANSTRYFDAQGAEQVNEHGRDRLIVVMSHHTIDSTTNEIATSPPFGQNDGEALRDLLLRFPNVILQVDGHTHRNKIWFHRSEATGTGYWEVNTSAVADLPTQSRVIEIADNRDGTLSIFATIFDAAVPPDPRAIDWQDDDPTDETRRGAARAVNENWLASLAREISYYDPQGDLTKIGEPEDRNVELLIEAPFELPRRALRRAAAPPPPGAGPELRADLELANWFVWALGLWVLAAEVRRRRAVEAPAR